MLTHRVNRWCDRGCGYRETTSAHCGGCGSHLRSPSAGGCNVPLASYLPPSESVGNKCDTYQARCWAACRLLILSTKEIVPLKAAVWFRQNKYGEIPGSDLDDVVFAEHTASVASVSVLSDGALHLRDTHTTKTQ